MSAHLYNIEPFKPIVSEQGAGTGPALSDAGEGPQPSNTLGRSAVPWSILAVYYPQTHIVQLLTTTVWSMCALCMSTVNTVQVMTTNVEEYTVELAERGVRSFATEDAINNVETSPDGVRAQIRRLRRKGEIATPIKSLHLIIPAEYRRVGCLPAEQFVDVLMKRLKQPYYVALLSAAERHGAAHQRPQAFQVMTTRNHRPVKCGRIRIEFIRKRDVQRVPTATLNVATGQVRYSTPEATALDLVGYPDHVGGLNNAATVLRELAPLLDPERLVLAATVSPLAWAQRLGYLLDVLGEANRTALLADFVAVRAKSAALLRRARKGAPSRRNAKWKLLINTDVDPDE